MMDVNTVPGCKININIANVNELSTLSGIGPAKAKNIVVHRETYGPFKSIEEITLVPGIGGAVFEKIRDRIVVAS